MVRLFVGIDLPPPQKLALSALANGLSGVRWVDPGNYHVTLCFIGAVSEDRAEDIHDALMKIALPGFDLAIQGLGVFATGERMRTLHAEIVREPGLLRLQEKVETTVMRLGLTHDHRRYSPHVTLARCHQEEPAGLRTYLAQWAGFSMPPFAVTAFHLVVSTLTKAGSHYECAATYPLTEVRAISGKAKA